MKNKNSIGVMRVTKLPRYRVRVYFKSRGEYKNFLVNETFIITTENKKRILVMIIYKHNEKVIIANDKSIENAVIPKEDSIEKIYYFDMSDIEKITRKKVEDKKDKEL